MRRGVSRRATGVALVIVAALSAGCQSVAPHESSQPSRVVASPAAAAAPLAHEQLLRASRPGYRLFATDGGIFSFGGATFHGSTGDRRLDRPIVAMAATPEGDGYWLASADGGVYTFGDARFRGSAGSRDLNQPIVTMVAPQSGEGYWLAAADGAVFDYGAVSDLGSVGVRRLTQPIVGMAPTRTGKGYWLVARDGGLFSFGDAGFFGALGGMSLRQPVVGMAATPSGRGYWLVARDGGVFAFGDAPFYGSTGRMTLNQPVVAIASTQSGRGYWLVAADGGVFAFGDAPYLGSTGNIRLNQPIAGMSVMPEQRPGDSEVARLQVAEEHHSGFDRNSFHYPSDDDADGCDTRNEVLMAESQVPVTVQAGCNITAGRWFSPYDGSVLTDPDRVDVDHIVELEEAWESGAFRWDDDRRRQFANDLDDQRSLLAVSARSAEGKGSQDPAHWRPSRREYWCEYAQAWTAVKLRWGLAADADEVRALTEMLGACY